MDAKNTENGKLDEAISVDERVRRLENNQTKMARRLWIKTVIVITCISIIVTVLVYENHPFQQVGGFPTTLNSGYEIFDLKGEKITTFVSWNVVSGDLFHIHVLPSPEVTPQRMADI